MKEFWVSSFRFGVSAFLVPFFLAAFAAADAGTTPGGLVREGNEAFEVGSYDEALKLYRKAAKEKPDSAEITFNQAAASYKKKDFTSATQLFLEAAQKAQDPSLSAKAEYNLGNSQYQQAQQAKEGGDLKESIKSTRQSVGHYREALRLNPAHRDAAENLELARGYLKALMEEQKQQPQNQQSQDGEQKDDEDKDKQQQQQTQSQEQKGQQGQEEQEESGKEQKGQPEQQSQENNDGQKEDEKQQASAQEKEDKDKKEAEKQQPVAEKKDEGKDQKDAAAKKEGDKIDQAARDILEEEKENLQRHMRVPAGMKPVDKDW